MIGHIESYDDERQTGAIKSEDGFYEFHIDDWAAETVPKIGDDVDFIPEDDGSASDVGLVGAYLKSMAPVKNHYIAAFLGLLLGAVGAHRLYLGFYTIAILQMIVTFITGGFGVVWGVVEGVLLFAGHIHKDAKGRELK